MGRDSLRIYLENHSIVNSHSHHLLDEEQTSLTLVKLLQNTYAAEKWLHFPTPTCAAEADPWLERVRTRSFYVWLEQALKTLYHIQEPLSSKTWGLYDERIREAHLDPQWHLQILKEQCHYERIALDAFWDPGADCGHPDLFTPAYRINSFLYGYDKDARDSTGGNAQIYYNTQIDDIDEYVDLLRRKIYEKKAAGCTALKTTVAYSRPLHFGLATKDQAQAALRFAGTQGSHEDIIHFQDYLFELICRLSAESGLPFQIHTGLARLTGANAMQLQQLIASHPETTFIIMHGSYPWLDDYAGLVMTHPNVVADICWLPLISPSAGRRALHELIEVCDADRICWGCDTWTSEESYGAWLAFQDTLLRVLEEKIAEGYMNEETAKAYADGILHDNADRIFQRHT